VCRLLRYSSRGVGELSGVSPVGGSLPLVKFVTLLLRAVLEQVPVPGASLFQYVWNHSRAADQAGLGLLRPEGLRAILLSSGGSCTLP